MKQIEIEKGLKKIGVKAGISVEVHSSLSSFGYVEDGAVAVINALKSIVTNRGTIIMPAFPLSKRIEPNKADKLMGISFKKKRLDLDSTERTDMGIIADTFRNDSDVSVGNHPLIRFSAWGNRADDFASNPVNLFKDDGYALLIGVDIQNLSAMHAAESHIPEALEPIISRHEPKDSKTKTELKKHYNLDEWEFTFSEDAPVTIGWKKVEDEAIEKDIIKIDYIGKCKVMFMKVNKVVDIYRRRLIEDPKKLFGL